MIKDILLPEKFGDYSLFSQHITGVDIGKASIRAAHIVLHARTVTIEQCLEEKIDQKVPGTEKTVAALKDLFSKISNPGQIKTSLSSASVIFKEVKIPFLDKEMINQVIKFEVEQLLPFPAHEAIIDCIVTKQYPDQKSSDVLVAAVQKHVVAQHLALFEQAGINPDIITVDMFALYGLYTQIPQYADYKEATVLMDFGVQATRLALITDGQLRIIRSITYGIQSIAKDISTATGQTPQQTGEHLVRFGLEQGDTANIHDATQVAVKTFVERVQFALTSLMSQVPQKKIEHLIILGDGATMNGFTSMLGSALGIPCESFNGTLLNTNPRYVTKNITITSDAILSIATAVPTTILDSFNLRKDEFTAQNNSLLLMQLLTGLGLGLFLIISLSTYSYVQTKRLAREARISEAEAIESIREQFPSVPDDEDLEEVIKLADSALRKEEEIWLAFTSQSRASFLEYLLELTTRINKQELGFVPEQLTIIDGLQSHIVLKARVRDFEALRKLEAALRESKLFSHVEGQTGLDFTMRITVARKERL